MAVTKKKCFSTALRTIKTNIIKHSPDILFWIGIGGMVSTVVNAVRVTPKALELIDKEKERKTELNREESIENEYQEYAVVDKLNFKDTVKVTWKCYVPVVVTGSLSMACLFGARSISMKRNAVLATAYGFSEAALSEYRDKVIETIGEKKEKTIQDSIAEDHIKKNLVENTDIVLASKDDSPCYDVMLGTKFSSSVDKIKKAQNTLNERLLSEMYVSLNDFYYELGVKPIGIGDSLGWNINDGLMYINISAHLLDDDTPCLAINYHVAPRYDYYSS